MYSDFINVMIDFDPSYQMISVDNEGVSSYNFEYVDPGITLGYYTDVYKKELFALGVGGEFMMGRKSKYDEAIFALHSLYIAPTFVIDDRIVTPSELSGNLRGITKNAIHKICSDNNITNIEIDLELEELDLATECFITSSTRGIMPVISLQLSKDNVIHFPRGGGEYTEKLITCYKEYLEEYVANNDDLLLYQKI